MAAPNPARQRRARERLAELFASPSSVFAMHYACESIETSQPRVISIVARNLGDGVIHSFSLHEEGVLAEARATHVRPSLDALELALLKKLYAFLGSHQRSTFVHWRMQSTAFGFAAIDLRHRVLGGQQQLPLHDSQKLDLHLLLTDIFGEDYAPSGHIESLARLNRLETAGMLKGRDEPVVYAEGGAKAVLMSTTRKVTLMCDIARLAHDGTLKTTKGRWVMNAGRVREAYQLIRTNPVYSLGALLAGVASGAFFIAMKVLEYMGR